MTNAGRLRRAVPAVLGLPGGAWLASCAAVSGLPYDGDGALRTRELWYPRYELRVGTVDVARAGEHAFSLSNIPSATYSVNLFSTAAARERDRTCERLSAVARLGPTMRLTILGDDGRILFDHAGTIPDGWSGERRCTVLRPPDNTVALARSKACTLTIRIEFPGAADPGLSLPYYVLMSGGGGVGQDL